MLTRLVLGLFCLFGLALPLHAACEGQDLRGTLAPETLVALRSEADAAPYARGILWRATRTGQEITLVGTLHLADSRHDETLEKLAPALSRATGLLVEAGPEEEAALQKALTTQSDMMFRSGGPTLPERLSETEWQALSKAAEARGFPPFLAAKMQPWFLSMMLAFSPCAMQELQQGGVGLDKLMVREAEVAEIPIRALEPYDTLFKLFGEMTAEEELVALRMALLGEARGDDMTATMVESYFDGEIRLIWTLSHHFGRIDAGAMMSDAEFAAMLEEAEEELVLARNRAWIPVIEDAAAAGPVVVAAGALHMPGEGGVLDLLAARGWSVTPGP